MGMKFGNLKRLTGVTYYVLSPHELKPFAGMLNPGFQNTVRRFSENILPIGIPMVLGYVIYSFSKEEHRKIHRKNPNDFKDDE